MSNFPARVDYNKAKIAAYVVVAGFLAIVFVFGVRSASGPQLHDGDRVESLDCPVCQGTGVGKLVDTRCQACLGNKTLKVVLPGPNHPVDIRGSVRDLAAFKDLAEAEQVAANDALDRKPSLTPVRGAVPHAAIVFEGGERVEMVSKATGKYWGMLPPGSYRVTVTAPGFAPYSQQLEVPPRQQPIWPEAGGIGPELLETQRFEIVMTPGG